MATLTNEFIFIIGCFSGIIVRFWRYKPDKKTIMKDLSIGTLSAVTLWHLLPNDIEPVFSFVTAYFSAQSAGFTTQIKKLKR